MSRRAEPWLQRASGSAFLLTKVYQSLKYTQRQKLSTTDFVAKSFRERLCDVKKIIASYRDKTVKKSCYFAKVGDGEFHKKYIGVNFFFIPGSCTGINVEKFV